MISALRRGGRRRRSLLPLVLYIFAGGSLLMVGSSATTDPLGLGNHVEIRHADGRVSWMLHMQPGSVRVKADERVRRGALIGKVGFTGDSLFPHLHYNVTDSATYPSQGMPTYFQSFTCVMGSRLV